MSKVHGTITYGGELPEDWAPDASPWRVTLRYQGREMTTPFYTGSALGEPTVADVLECLLLDAMWGDKTFEEWAADLGYDTDSRRAEALYRKVVRQTESLRYLLGEDFDTAVQDTEQDEQGTRWARTHSA